MTDDPTPTPPKVPPKLSIRPSAVSQAAKTTEDADQNAAATPVGPDTEQTAAQPASPEKPETNSTGKPDAMSPTPPGSSEAPTLILEKPPESGAMDSKKKTSRIPLDIALTSRIDKAIEKTESSAPRTVRLARPSAGKEPGDAAADEDANAPATIRLSPPPAAKREDSGGPKTIRLQRPGSAPTKASPLPDHDDSGDTSQKSKTSRISLDEALKAEGGQRLGSATGIKTIRLKKPGETPAPSLPPGVEIPPSVNVEEAKSRTARLDTPEGVAAGAEDAAPATQRKTIRIKRPGGSVADASKPARKLSLARDRDSAAADTETVEGAETDITADAAVPARAPADEGGLVWTLVAVAAMLMAAVVVYLLAVQAFPDAGLSWPGQINI